MRTNPIHAAREGRLTIITIDRPEAANALSPDASWELARVIDDFAADPDQWVAILTATGDRSFCSGTDLKVRAAQGRQPLPPSGFGGLTLRFDLDKPLIAAVNGVAYGGGFEIALCCDMVVASERAKFALREVHHGLAALAGGIHRLARQVPERMARELILTGRDVDADEALALGLINAVVPHAALLDEARAWAERLLQLSPMALRASKQTMQRGLDEPSLVAALERQDDYPAIVAMRASEDLREGLAAFVEKRPARWVGR